MAKQEYYKFTHKHNKISRRVADNINKDFPGTATVSDGVCWILQEYWDKCVAEVSEIHKAKKKLLEEKENYEKILLDMEQINKKLVNKKGK